MKSLFRTGYCLFALVALTGCEIEQARYATVAEARKAGLFSRGWAPDVLPEDAGPIAEAHDLDTNARCFRAGFPSSALSDVRSALLRARFHGHSGASDQHPEGLCPFTAADLAHLQLLRRERSGAQREYAALDSNGVVYYWSNGDASP